MDPLPEYSLFLIRILEELDTKYNTTSYEYLCKSLCTRFDLVLLAKLRSLLFYTASLDPAFPATLFKDKMRSSMEDPQSKKLVVAADIVTMFNLIQENGGKLPIWYRPKFHKKQYVELCGSENEAYNSEKGAAHDRKDRPWDGNYHPHQHPLDQNAIPSLKALEHTNCQPLIPTSDPNFLLGASKDLTYTRAASFDKLHHLPQYSNSSLPSPSNEMQSTYFPMQIDSESATEQDSRQHIDCPEPFSVHSCMQKRNIFKEDFHYFLAFSPQVITTECKQGSVDYQRRKPHQPANSFHLPDSNPYFESTFSQDRRAVKHESLDDLQASMYISECVSGRRQSNKAGKQTAWPVKSLSLKTEEGPPDLERSFLNSKGLKEHHRHNTTMISSDNEQHFQNPDKKVLASVSGFAKKANGKKSKDKTCMMSGPGLKDKTGKRFWHINIQSPKIKGENSATVATQTEQTEQRRVKECTAKYREREGHAFKHSNEDSEIVSDDISDIFHFLDDMSICDSLGVIQSSCYDSYGSLSQVTLCGCDGTPERNTVKLAKSKLHSLENTDGELKSCVGKLMVRICDIEKKLESLSGVHSEISQVLSKLNKLDENIQEPEDNGRHGETTSTSRSTPENILPFPQVQPHTSGHNVKMDNSTPGEWCCPDMSKSENCRMKALKDNRFTKKLLNEESSVTKSKLARITSSPYYWRKVSYSCNPREKGKDKDGDRNNKNKQEEAKEAGQKQPFELPQAHWHTKAPKVYHPFQPSIKAQVKGSQLTLSSFSDRKCREPSWTIEEFKCSSRGKEKQLTALDLQTQESQNPNSLAYWIEDVYTPGFNSLLKRKKSEFRKAKACKIGALIAAAICIVIPVVIILICTMKT
ncbi:major intrinsically disordered Notch2-binding receptor 1 [Genypterus blacodes]|uniref:major intrinsically disordered Notch2-binding receptor 1 n=1 Tax=Genypterus blacodes TaxID=154954 RepID=UPI003F75B97D